jgi:hypothetical protein
MRKDSLLAGVICLGLFGCVTGPRLLDEVSDQTSLTSDRIVIRASTFRGSDGWTPSQYDWKFEKNGKSKGTLHFAPIAIDQGTTTQYEFPAGIYEECLAKLEETRFFRMKSAHAPSGTLDESSATIEVHYHGRKHVVTQVGAAATDDGFNKMWLFLGDVQKRSTVVPTEWTPGRIKRTGAQLGGVITGLTPAGTLTPDIRVPIRNGN